MLKWQQVLVYPGICRIAIEPVRPFVPVEIVQIFAAGRPLAFGDPIGFTISTLTIDELDPAFGPSDGVRNVFGAKRDNFFADEVLAFLKFQKLLEPGMVPRGAEDVLGFRTCCGE
jgi:hypothetical protein